MNVDTHKDSFLESLGRCRQSQGFIPTFYGHFLSSSEIVNDKFKDTNFERQELMLLRSLELCARATSGDPAGLRELRERTETHDRHHLDIDARFYALWLDAILRTARQFDPQWSDELERSWRKTLGHVINHMIANH